MMEDVACSSLLVSLSLFTAQYNVQVLVCFMPPFKKKTFYDLLLHTTYLTALSHAENLYSADKI